MTYDELEARIRNGESFIMANDFQYLGKLTSNSYDSDSVFNPYGNYGNRYATYSIWNEYSSYGSPYSSLSPNNQYTNTPPMIFVRGQKVCYLTNNSYFGYNSISPSNLKSFIQRHNL